MSESKLKHCFPHVYMRDATAVQEKLTKMMTAGMNKLHVISDFDFTMTRSSLNGVSCQSSYGAIETSLKGTDSGAELISLTEKYRPMEFSHTLTHEEKVPLMVQWWQESHDVIVKSKLSKKRLEESVAQSNIRLRDGVNEFVDLLDHNNVPLIVFSAGIATVIEIFFQQQLGKIPQNVHIISNLIQFDSQTDIIVGFKEPLIHTFNKNSTVLPLEQPKFFDRLVDRPMVLLFGDCIGDSHMDVGLVAELESLKIGFLNKDFDRLLPSYMEAFDVVVPNDQSMSVPNWILQQILDAQP